MVQSSGTNLFLGGILVPSKAKHAKIVLVHSIVTKLLKGHHNKGHVVVVNNYFTSIVLLEELLAYGIYATSTIWSNQIGLLQ